jgi:hypothetical protein
MKGSAMPAFSVEGQQALEDYRVALRDDTDTNAATVHNYPSFLHRFLAWCEVGWAMGQETAPTFTPAALTTTLIICYRIYLPIGSNGLPAPPGTDHGP